MKYLTQQCNKNPYGFITCQMTCTEENVALSLLSQNFSQKFIHFFCFTVFIIFFFFFTLGKNKLFCSWLIKDQIFHLFSVNSVVCRWPKPRELQVRNPVYLHLSHSLFFCTIIKQLFPFYKHLPDGTTDTLQIS